MEHPTQPTSSLFKHPFASSRHPQESQTLETPGNFRLIAFILVKLFISSVRSSYSHPDLLLTPLFQITPVLNTGLSLSEPLQLYIKAIMLYKGNHWTHLLAYG